VILNVERHLGATTLVAQATLGGVIGKVRFNGLLIELFPRYSLKRTCVSFTFSLQTGTCHQTFGVVSTGNRFSSSSRHG
jgi:hypothetical protein